MKWHCSPTDDKLHAMSEVQSAVAKAKSEQTHRLKQRTAGMSIAVTTTLTVTKIVVGILTGSIAIISEGLHSLMDMIAAMIAYYSIKKGGEPADEVHHYGHTKFEAMGAFIEGLIILIPYVFILYYAIRHLHTTSVNEAMLGWGILLMALSVAANLAASARLNYVAKMTDSLALRGDALHLFSDGITSAAVLVALWLIKAFGYVILDPIFAIAVSIYIIYVSIILLKRSGAQLLDAAPAEEGEIQKRISEIVSEFPDEVINFHNFRCRGLKPTYFIDFHLLCCRHLSIKESHDLCDRLEERIKLAFPQCDLTVHIEPCEDQECENTQVPREPCHIFRKGDSE